ncbi:MAG: 4Fe-4S binding protein [Candidatus Helarchaeota archaeon]
MQTKTPPHGQPPEKFKIVSAFMILCNNCRRCIEVCPANAITIKLP